MLNLSRWCHTGPEGRRFHPRSEGSQQALGGRCGPLVLGPRPRRAGPTRTVAQDPPPARVGGWPVSPGCSRTCGSPPRAQPHALLGASGAGGRHPPVSQAWGRWSGLPEAPIGLSRTRAGLTVGLESEGDEVVLEAEPSTRARPCVGSTAGFPVQGRHFRERQMPGRTRKQGLRPGFS